MANSHCVVELPVLSLTVAGEANRSLLGVTIAGGLDLLELECSALNRAVLLRIVIMLSVALCSLPVRLRS